MKKIYFDNAATSFPKPDGVAEAVYNYIKFNGMNIGRGAYMGAFSSAEGVYETREHLCRLFNFDKPSNVVFTVNITEALNMVIKGLLKAGDHVIVSSLEHNAVMRPLTQLLEKGVTFDRAPCDETGKTYGVEELIKENTKAVIMCHASNVCGSLAPMEEIGRICRKHNLLFIADCAQSAGSIPVDMEKMDIDILCFTGHKALLGPQGTGGFIIRDEAVPMLEPLISGGTGSVSNLETLPEFMPDRFEAGTLNIAGIYGLKAGLEFIDSVGVESIHSREMRLTKLFLDGLKDIKGCRIIGKNTAGDRTAVVSVVTDRDLAETAFLLDREYGIMTRVGMHCAPNAHKVLGTYPSGTLRFSFGYFNTGIEIEYALDALKKILEK